MVLRVLLEVHGPEHSLKPRLTPEFFKKNIDAQIDQIAP
jgi:hypothetical protein